jgi:hypothetical protein
MLQRVKDQGREWIVRVNGADFNQDMIFSSLVPVTSGLVASLSRGKILLQRGKVQGRLIDETLTAAEHAAPRLRSTGLRCTAKESVHPCCLIKDTRFVYPRQSGKSTYSIRADHARKVLVSAFSDRSVIPLSTEGHPPGNHTSDLATHSG